MNQHIKALQDAQTELSKHYSNATGNTAQYGEWAYLVGLAVDRWGYADKRADAANYNNQLLNAESEQAYSDYQTILETVQLVRSGR